MAESGASESSIVNKGDLSDQIDAELSEEGGNICQAEESLSVGPYNRKDMHKPYRVSRNEQPARSRGWSIWKIEMTKTFGEVRKKPRINEY